MQIYAPVVRNPEPLPTTKRKGRKLPRFLKPAEIDALNRVMEADLARATTFKQRRRAQRNYLMVHVGLLAGPRVSEICNIDLRDVDMPGARLMIRQGKNSKDRWLPLHRRLMELLRAWLGDRTSGPLFPTDRQAGGPIGRYTFYWTLRGLAKKAGLVGVTPHVLRHTCACDLLDKGADIIQVRDVLGHESVATTNVYLHTTPNRLREAIDRL